jgi:hypothetical protein
LEAVARCSQRARSTSSDACSQSDLRDSSVLDIEPPPVTAMGSAEL